MKIYPPIPGFVFRHIMENTSAGKKLEQRPGIRLAIISVELALWLGSFALGWFLGGLL